MSASSEQIRTEEGVFKQLIQNYGYTEGHILEQVIPEYAECIREALSLGYPIDAITNMIQEKIATGELP